MGAECAAESALGGGAIRAAASNVSDAYLVNQWMSFE